MTVTVRAAKFMILAGAGAALMPLTPAAAAPLPRPAQFAMCGVCHKTGAGEPSGIGPNLWQVGGRKAGTLAGFNYSPAMKASNLTWNKDTLSKYIAAPAQTVPGNKMAYAGQKDPKALAAIVDYLLSLK
ncbi:c-type cytochrome [Sphingomonas quercus]|nr:c-type cytochrome [Sphingomonas quercus]